MEHCDRHDGTFVFCEHHRVWQYDCPLCVALEAVAEKEKEIEELSSKLETVEEMLSEAQETISEYGPGG